MRMRATTVVAWGAVLGVTAGFAACSLNLDKSKIQGHDAGTDTSTGGSAGFSGSGGTGGSGGVMEAGSECDASAQCLSDAGCIKGSCQNGNCVYDLCPTTQACTASTCDKGTQTCSAPTTYGFNAGSINLAQDLGCGNSAERCIAAMGDYVFVGTDSGLKAWHVTNPKAPEAVPVSQPPFALTISRMISSGNRVLVLGPTVGGAKLNAAWIDLPTEAAPKQIQTNNVQLAFTDTYTVGYPADGNGFLLVKNDQGAFYPSGRVDPPLNDNDPLSLSPCNGLPSGAYIVGASGKRLIQFRIDTTSGTFDPIFGFENDGGTPSSQYGGDADLVTDAGEVPTSLSAHRFESAYNGALLWATNNIQNIDAGVKESDAVVLHWPLLNGTDTTFDGKRMAIIERYPALFSYNNGYAGRIGLINSTTALITAAYANDTTQTSVRSVQRSGSTLTVSPAPPAPGFVIAVNVNSIGVAAGRTYGYVLKPNQATAPSAPDTKLFIFDPDCK